MPPADPRGAARAAGLVYTTDATAGCTRQARDGGFTYRDAHGRVIRAAAVLARIRGLVIPPAWTDVWISPDPRGHLQATGRDVRGRKQYRYHPDWRAVRDETKYHRVLAFATTLPQIRRKAGADLEGAGLTRTRVLAAIVHLLERTLIRVGNDEYARTNHSYGLTTMRDAHVQVRGGRLRFVFTGKSGVAHDIDLDDRRLARIVKACRDIPGHDLFQYYDDQGQRQTVGSGDVNAYLREIAGEGFTSKDFRTWAGTVLAATLLRGCDTCQSEAEAKRNIVTAVDAVARRLGNTKAVCRKCYIHPVVFEAYLDGDLARPVPVRARRPNALGVDETTVLALLRRRLTSPARGRRSRAAVTAPAA